MFDEVLVNEGIAIKWFIYRNGGNACKSAVEDVLMLRHGIDRGMGHEIMNHIEFHQLDQPVLRDREWRGNGDEPTIERYPEIKQVNIRWWKEVDGRTVIDRNKWG